VDHPLVPLAVAALAAAVLTLILAEALRRRRVLDRPNQRSSHSAPTPRGGGLAIVAVLALGWATVTELRAPAVLLLLLAAVGFVDDLRDLPVRLRLMVQALAVGAGLALLPEVSLLGGVLPFWLERGLIGLGWLWFVNLFNFMDGIDGIAGQEAAAIGLGIALLGGALAEPGLWLAGAALGFLALNWPPARVFMGDAGSIPLGFGLGYLLLLLAAEGQWAAAIILPLYFCADATLTLLRRLARGDKVWQAHRQHFYQRAVQARGGRHRPVLIEVVALNLVLVALAYWSTQAPWPALVLAGLATAFLLWRFARLQPRLNASASNS